MGSWEDFADSMEQKIHDYHIFISDAEMIKKETLESMKRKEKEMDVLGDQTQSIVLGGQNLERMLHMEHFLI